MLSNNEIRKLPIPKINSEVQLLASQNINSGPIMITVNKVKTYICMNVFVKEDEEVLLAFRYFVKGSEGILYNIRKNKITNGYLINALDNLEYRYSIIATTKNREKFQKWVNEELGTNYDQEVSTEQLIRNFEWHLSNYRKTQKMIACEKYIDSIMKKVKKIPKSFDKSVRKAMEFSQYIFFDRENNKGICSCCGNSIILSELPKFREREQGYCPVCNAKIEYKSEKRRKSTRNDEGMAVLLQAYAQESLIARYFHIRYDHSKPVNGKPTIYTTEVIRTIIDYKNKNISDYEWYWYNGKIRWSLPQKSMFCPEGIHHKFLPGAFHKKGLTKELRLASLENRFTNKELVERTHGLWSKSSTSCYKYIHYYEIVAKNPAVEKLAKCGLINLASHFYRGVYSYHKNVIDQNASSLREVLKLKNMTQVREAIECNISYDDLRQVQHYNEISDKQRDVKAILQIAHNFVGRENEAFVLPDSVIKKITMYLQKNNAKVTDYFDYINNCRKLNYNMKSEMVLYPKHFKEAHDMAFTNVKEKQLEKTYEEIEKLLPEMHKIYDFEDEDLLLTAPNAGKEITYEGQAMNHCVGGYVSDVATGKTVILFIRKKEEPTKPYVTMEVRDNRIIQVRAFGNATPPDNVKQFVNKFREVKKLAA